MKAGAVESIITDVIKVLKTTSSNTMPQVAKKVLESNEDIDRHKVAANVLKSKEDIDGHNPWIDIIKEKEPIQLYPCTSIATDGLLQMKISNKAPQQKVDHMAEEKVTESADKKTSKGFNDSKVENKNDRFLLSMRNFAKKDSKILKFLFENVDNGVDDAREEVARYRDIGVSYGELQCLRPTFPLLRKIIDISGAYLYEEDSKSLFLPTCFREQAYSNHVSSDSHALVASTIHLCRLQRFHRCLKRCSKLHVQIFIPLHDEIKDQWFLLVIKLDRKSAEMCDSLTNIVSSTQRFEKARVATIFENEMTKSDDVYHHFPSFCITIPQNNPTHDNKYDSGIYIIRHVQWYGEKWFEGQTILALEIVNHPKNELLRSVSTATVGLQKSKDSGQGLSTSTKPLTLTTDFTIGCDKLMSNTNDIPHTGRKCRSHHKRRSACDA